MRSIPLQALSSLPGISLKIKFDEDVDLWRTTSGYRDYTQFLTRLTSSVRGVFMPYQPETLSNVPLVTLLGDPTLSHTAFERP